VFVITGHGIAALVVLLTSKMVFAVCRPLLSRTENWPTLVFPGSAAAPIACEDINQARRIVLK
jgi:hypothetical protein